MSSVQGGKPLPYPSNAHSLNDTPKNQREQAVIIPLRIEKENSPSLPLTTPPSPSVITSRIKALQPLIADWDSIEALPLNPLYQSTKILRFHAPSIYSSPSLGFSLFSLHLFAYTFFSLNLIPKIQNFFKRKFSSETNYKRFLTLQKVTFRTLQVWGDPKGQTLGLAGMTLTRLTFKQLPQKLHSLQRIFQWILYIAGQEFGQATWHSLNLAPIAKQPLSSTNRTCNALESLCSQHYKNSTFPTTHNSMHNAIEGQGLSWFLQNQIYSIETQFNHGIRGFMLDIRVNDKGTLLLTHNKAFDFHPLKQTLNTLYRLLKKHPREMIYIDFEVVDTVSISQLHKAFNESQLYSLTPQKHAHYSLTIGQMLEKNIQCLVNHRNSLIKDIPPPPYLATSLENTESLPSEGWTQTEWNNFYAKDFQCQLKPEKSTPFSYAMNHFVSWLREEFSAPVNRELARKVYHCVKKIGQAPILLAINHFHSAPSLFKVTNCLNDKNLCDS